MDLFVGRKFRLDHERQFATALSARHACFEQVLQDHHQTRAIADQMIGHILFNGKPQLNVLFLNLRHQLFQHIGDAIAQMEFHRFEFDVTAFKLRKVEQIGDLGKRRLGRRFNAAEVLE